VLFVAGGVGINPLIAMLKHLDCEEGEMERLEGGVEFVYSTKVPEDEGGRVLFLEELQAVQDKWSRRMHVRLFMTGDLAGDEFKELNESSGEVKTRRVMKYDLRKILGDDGLENTVAYICGPPQMTDEFVAYLTDEMKMPEERVLCEKWW
jgi:NAD(P)H-flavin reductase